MENGAKLYKAFMKLFEEANTHEKKNLNIQAEGNEVWRSKIKSAKNKKIDGVAYKEQCQKLQNKIFIN